MITLVRRDDVVCDALPTSFKERVSFVREGTGHDVFQVIARVNTI